MESFFKHDRLRLRGTSGPRQTTMPSLISTYAKCGLHLRRPLLATERKWLQKWFQGTSYFSSHRRLSRGMARRLCHEMGAEVGTLRMPRVIRPVHDPATVKLDDAPSNKPHTSGAPSIVDSRAAQPPKERT